MKVLVTGFFDMLHVGHLHFLEEASKLGDLYVCVGNDNNMLSQKGKLPLVSENDRLKMVKSLKCVKDAFVPKATGTLDFSEVLHNVLPDMFCVNDDGDKDYKRMFCKSCGVKYKVLMNRGKIPQSSTNIRKSLYMPYRLCLAGAGLDQPYLSKLYSGINITVSIEPTHNFMERGGMATSTRNRAIKLWRNLPLGDEFENAKTLFNYDNSPDNKFVNGYQDAVGIMKKGIVVCNYDGKYLPIKENFTECEDYYKFIEKYLFLIPLKPRPKDYDLFNGAVFHKRNALLCSFGADMCRHGIKQRDVVKFGKGMYISYQGYIKTFKSTFPKYIKKTVKKYKKKYNILGWKLTGAGGGGYLVLVSDEPIKDALRIKIRR